VDQEIEAISKEREEIGSQKVELEKEIQLTYAKEKRYL
jgi:hypothetical protein